MVFDPLNQSYGFLIAAVGSIPFLAVILLLVYFPLTGFLGGWDKVNLEEFRKAAYMSGPSKWIIVPIFKMVNWCCQHSPLHDKFGMPTAQVIQDAKDLLLIKRANREDLKERMKKE
jgi:hypothetical protein